MSDQPRLVLRLAAPLQSWGVYRFSGRRATTLPVPSKTGVAGLLGACMGRRDHRALMDEFDYEVRVDRTNAFVTDLQTASGPRIGRDEDEWVRAASIATMPPKSNGIPVPKERAKADGRFVVGGGSLHEMSLRDYIPHAEFLVTLAGDQAAVGDWYAAVHDPVYMPYLGRAGAAPEFPFLLGVAPAGLDVLAQAPRVPRHDELPGDVTSVPRYSLSSDVNVLPGPTPTTAPVVPNRKEYLEWFSRHLNR